MEKSVAHHSNWGIKDLGRPKPIKSLIFKSDKALHYPIDKSTLKTSSKRLEL